MKRYAEFWKEAADIKDNSKFLKKVESSSQQLKQKYGEDAYLILEFLILRLLREPETEGDKMQNLLINRAVVHMSKKAKGEKYSPSAFPHPVMLHHEVCCICYIR